ncbi:MAG: class I SAM-dependent methyltransferase [Thermodesulfobacteriota bacterium]
MYHQLLYSNIARFYDLFLYLNNYKRAVDYFVMQISFHENQPVRLLDAGAGTGLYTLAILKRFPHSHITAIDINENMVRRLKSSLEMRSLANSVSTILSDARYPIPEIEGEEYDLIVAGGLLEHVDTQLTIKNLSRYLRVNGLFFNSPVKNNFWGRFVGLTMGFKPYEDQINIRSFTDNGFIHLKKIPLPIKYFPISWVKEGDLFRKVR